MVVVYRVKGHRSDYSSVESCNHDPEGSDWYGASSKQSGFPSLATIPFHIPFRHSSPVVVDSLSLV